jgi:hypothetical protein
LRISAAVAFPLYIILASAPGFRHAVTTPFGLPAAIGRRRACCRAITVTAPKSFIAFLPPPVQAEEGRGMRPKL